MIRMLICTPGSIGAASARDGAAMQACNGMVIFAAMPLQYKVILIARFMGKAAAICVLALAGLYPGPSRAGGGPLGIDHEWSYSNHGVWSTHYEQGLVYGVMLFEAGGALLLGDDEDGFGHTLWQSVDASVFSGVSAEILKIAFSRARPIQGGNPDKWFQGSCCASFPSGQVTLQASFVTPIILHYAHSEPWIWALELLPAYDALARLKHHDHWQTDVIAGWALGTAAGYWAAKRETPVMVQILPRGLSIGFVRHF
jgi:undecaprenyl-diphosphatase